MKALAAFAAGVLLALGLPALAHDADHQGEHHADCAHDDDWLRPGGSGSHVHPSYTAALDAARPHDSILVDLNVCLRDVDYLRLRVEIEEYAEGRWQDHHGVVSWRVAADGLAEGVIGHLDADTSYRLNLRRSGHRIDGGYELRTAAAPTEPVATTTSSTTTLAPCAMPTTTTTTSTTTTTTEAPAATVRMPDVVAVGPIFKAQASEIITAVGLVPAPRAVPTDNPTHDLLVFDQDPPAGATLPAGSTVRFDYWSYTPPDGG